MYVAYDMMMLEVISYAYYSAFMQRAMSKKFETFQTINASQG